MNYTFAALKIHISPQCKEYLDKLGGYTTIDRGLVKMKVGSSIQLHRELLITDEYLFN